MNAIDKRWWNGDRAFTEAERREQDTMDDLREDIRNRASELGITCYDSRHVLGLLLRTGRDFGQMEQRDINKAIDNAIADSLVSLVAESELIARTYNL